MLPLVAEPLTLGVLEALAALDEVPLLHAAAVSAIAIPTPATSTDLRLSRATCIFFIHFAFLVSGILGGDW
ncbi:MAG TPA: hypothetical protein VFO01_13795 [Trebonia sp.]|nr:hypothetical protein [Trebonia sp.]